MRGEVAQMTEFGSAIAKHDLPLLYKVLFKVGSPTFIVNGRQIVGAQRFQVFQKAVQDALADGAGKQP